jgi:hypothetical protein
MVTNVAMVERYVGDIKIQGIKDKTFADEI